jgi:hypothetical protein
VESGGLRGYRWHVLELEGDDIDRARERRHCFDVLVFGRDLTVRDLSCG